MHILVGGRNKDLYVQCDTNALLCSGTKTRKQATRFFAYPVEDTDKFALVVPGTNLCLVLWSSSGSGNVNL
jgi:hypothetical protein